MELIRPSTLADFRRLVEPLVLAHEAEHGLIYGVAGASSPAADAYCALVVDEDIVVAAAIRTSEKMVLSRENASGAIAMIARDAIHDPGLRGLLGPPQSLRAFVEASGRDWSAGRGSTIYECRRSRVHAAGELRPRVCERARRGRHAASARPWSRVRLPLCRSCESDVEFDLSKAGAIVVSRRPTISGCSKVASRVP